MKLRIVDIIVTIMLLFVLINNIVNRNNTDPTSITSLEPLKEYLVDIDKHGTNVVVILVSGTVYVEGQPIEFVDRKFLEIAQRELIRANYTVITLSTPCSVRCLEEYTRLGLLIDDLGANAVIYKGIHSDFGTDTLNRVLQRVGIPIYSFGSEVVLDYELYVGPNNIDIGNEIVEGIKPIVQAGQRAIYIETTSVLNTNALDNGFERINAAREGLELLGVETVETVRTLWSRARTYDEIVRVLSREGPVEYIIAPSVETAEGAILAIENLGYSTQDIKVIGADLTPKSIKLIEQGRLYGVISQELSEQALYLVDAIITGYEADKSKRLYASELITIANLNNYKLGDNTYKW